MTIPLSQYVSIKDKYCINYFGSNNETIVKLLKARELIERKLPSLKIYLAIKDDMRSLVRGKKNVILECNMGAYRGKVAYSRTLEENEAVEYLLGECDIEIPDDF